MIGLRVTPKALRRVHQLPVAEGTGTVEPQSLLPRRGKELFQHQAVLPHRLKPLDALSCVEEGFIP